MNAQILKLDITWTAIFKIVVIAALIYTLFLIRDVVILGLLALIISIIFNPLISFLEKKRFPRTLAAITVYLSFVIIFSLIIYAIVPPIAAETKDFSANLSHYFTQINNFLKLNNIDLTNIGSIFNLSPNLGNGILSISGNIINFALSVFDAILAIVTVFALAAFLSIEEKDLNKMIKLFSPKKWEESVSKAWEKSQEQVMGWFGSRVLSSIGVAILTFIACLLLNIKFAVSIGFLAGILNIVPMIGPVLVGVILIAFAFMGGWVKVLLALLFTVLIQQIEHNVFMPLFTKKMVGIPNFLVLISILVGGELLGVIGAILAIPLGAILYETLKNYSLYKKEQN